MVCGKGASCRRPPQSFRRRWSSFSTRLHGGRQRVLRTSLAQSPRPCSRRIRWKKGWWRLQSPTLCATQKIRYDACRTICLWCLSGHFWTTTFYSGLWLHYFNQRLYMSSISLCLKILFFIIDGALRIRNGVNNTSCTWRTWRQLWPPTKKSRRHGRYTRMSCKFYINVTSYVVYLLLILLVTIFYIILITIHFLLTFN